MDLTKLTALEIGKKIQNKELSAVEATKSQIEFIKQNNNLYNSFITILEEEAMLEATKVQEKIDRGELEN